MQFIQSSIGIVALLAVAYGFSENRDAIRWKTVGYAIGLQAVLALVLLKLPVTRHLFLMLNVLVNTLETALQAGTTMVFGYLGGGAPPFAETGASTYIFAFRGLPMVLLASALSALLFYWGVLPGSCAGPPGC
ncbi:Na+ dependent nucleoside transporter N-terminal domain-containing protein [Desulfosarcina cetonica]|uniref:Na+ dependent nucleoside transporter N-terminal domain-containing protein n=1 Tax=Desulfosarcina cetonica TaxID=90730 RepID=UPI001FEFEACD|nr:Na+ dependent nucleoside transporter N-terminal domain-containing protein [Desulfosarcina cetonica]